jgi:pimeloyl-ACP methyl ester carboxylesterase
MIHALRLSFLERKAGRVGMLLIHGNSSSKEVFKHQFRELSETNFSIVAPDLPGHGASERSNSPRTTYSFPAYAEILHKLMAELEYRSYHILGWSLGGHIGLEMMARYPAVRSLVLTGTPPVVLTPAGIASGFRWTPSTALAGKLVFTREDAVRYVRAMMGTRHVLAKQVAVATHADGEARRWMVRNGMAGVGADEVRVVENDDRPIAILQGRADPFVRTDYLLSLSYRNIWSGSPLLIDAGHAAHWQASVVFNKHMKDFLIHAN